MAQGEPIYVHYSKVRGYHVYKDIWKAPIAEVLACRKEVGNVHDPYCVAVIDRQEVSYQKASALSGFGRTPSEYLSNDMILYLNNEETAVVALQN